MANEVLDGALDSIPATPELYQGGSDDDVVSQLETLLEGGETAQEEAVETETEEEVETPEEEEVDETTESTDEDETEEEVDEDADEGNIELTEAQFAEAMGLESDSAKLDDEGNLLIKTKVDGEVSFKPMKDLIASYQMESHLQRQIKTAAEERKVYDTQKAEEQTRVQTTITDASALVGLMEQELMAAVQQVDMNTLRRENPAEWAATQQDISNRQMRIGQVKQQVGKMIQEQQVQQRDKSEAVKAQNIKDETEKLITAIPTWSDPEIASKEISVLQKELISRYGDLGATAEKLASIPEAWMIAAFRDLVKNGDTEKVSKVVKKKLKAVPKIMKSGNKSKNSMSHSRKIQIQKQQLLEESGSTQDAVSVLLDMI